MHLTAAPARLPDSATAAEAFRPIQQPPRLASTPSIQVSIGSIDLRVTPPEPPRTRPGLPRRRPQGFDHYRGRRSYDAWEE
ncbi:MAG: hypothetical protein EOM24_16840 [Chloroflexia bacterium]|nr:hypothetical protein [Chloroflexia bacterium]